MGLLSKAASGSSNFKEPHSRGGLLKIISQKQNKIKGYGSDTAINKAPKGPLSSPMEKAIMDHLNSGYANFGAFQGVIIEALKYSAGEFTGRLSNMVSGFGAAQSLAPGRCLVLFSSTKDGELIGRHLAKTVPGNDIFSFQAKNPQEAFSLIKPYL